MNQHYMESLFEILTKEAENQSKIYLYKEENDIWRAYEYSAYLLSKFIALTPNSYNRIFSRFEISLTITEISFVSFMQIIALLPVIMGKNADEKGIRCIEIETAGKNYEHEPFLTWKNFLNVN